MSNNEESDFKGGLKSIIDPTLYLDNLSLVGKVDTLAKCIYRELIESKQSKFKCLAELRGYKAFRKEVKEIIIEYLRKKGIEDSFIQDKNRRKIEEIKNDFINGIVFSNNGIIFFDMEETEGKPKQDKFIGYMYKIDRNRNLIKKVHTIMWDLDREGLPKSRILKYSWGQIDYLVETIVEKLETVVNQQGVAISGKHIIEYIKSAERQLLDEDTLKYYYDFDHGDTHLGNYSWREYPKFVGDYTVSKDNPHLFDVKVCYSFDTGEEFFKASKVNGEFQRTRRELDFIPFLDGSSIINSVITNQKIIDKCKYDPVLSVISSNIYDILECAYDFILQRFQVEINNMCKTESDLSNDFLLEIQSSGTTKEK